MWKFAIIRLYVYCDTFDNYHPYMIKEADVLQGLPKPGSDTPDHAIYDSLISQPITMSDILIICSHVSEFLLSTPCSLAQLMAHALGQYNRSVIFPPCQPTEHWCRSRNYKLQTESIPLSGWRFFP